LQLHGEQRLFCYEQKKPACPAFSKCLQTGIGGQAAAIQAVPCKAGISGTESRNKAKYKPA
jgi:hypothetical protein